MRSINFVCYTNYVLNAYLMKTNTYFHFSLKCCKKDKTIQKATL